MNLIEQQQWKLKFLQSKDLLLVSNFIIKFWLLFELINQKDKQSVSMSEKFNIFGMTQNQPDKYQSLNLFTTINNSQENNTFNAANQYRSKKQQFGNQIRRLQRETLKKNHRQQVIKSIESNKFFMMLEQLAIKSNIQSKHVSNLISDLRRNMKDLDFCTKLDHNNKIKQFILRIYLQNPEDIPLRQKAILLQSLVFLTYYSQNSLQSNQKKELCSMIVKELSDAKNYNCQTMEYISTMIDLLTNMIADQASNNYLTNSNILDTIVSKINDVQMQSNKALQKNDNDLHFKYEQDLSNIRLSFIQTLLNLSYMRYNNEYIFEFTVNEIVADKKYLIENGAKVLKIFESFFRNQIFRAKIFDNPKLTGWFQYNIFEMCQKRFSDKQHQKNGQFGHVIMSQGEKQLFFNLLGCLEVCINKGDFKEQLKLIIVSNLNPYCLSQFLIQCASINDQEHKKSRYTSKAISIYQYLASQEEVSIDQLLIVTSERVFQDILKVFLDPTFFTSCKISDTVLSVLNKMLCKDQNILRSLIELRIFDSIKEFLEMEVTIQSTSQILNFLQLITIMVDTENNLKRQNSNQKNEVVRILEGGGFIKNIQRYQQCQSKQVFDKTEVLLKYLEAYHDSYGSL